MQPSGRQARERHGGRGGVMASFALYMARKGLKFGTVQGIRVGHLRTPHTSGCLPCLWTLWQVTSFSIQILLLLCRRLSKLTLVLGHHELVLPAPSHWHLLHRRSRRPRSSTSTRYLWSTSAPQNARRRQAVLSADLGQRALLYVLRAFVCVCAANRSTRCVVVGNIFTIAKLTGICPVSMLAGSWGLIAGT